MPRKQRDVERGLVKKGFQRTESHHHFFVYYSCDGKKTTVKTKTSHGTRELSSYILQQMARQIQLSKIDFLNLIDCPMSRHQYEEHLVSLAKIP